MYSLIIFGIVLLLGCATKSFRIPYESNKIPYLEKNVFQLKSIEDPCFYNTKNLQPKYMIFWYEWYIDSSLVITIHPKQILVRSINNNPNPMFLYWLVDIDESQYKEICFVLDNHQIIKFSNNDVWQFDNYNVLRCEKCLIMKRIEDPYSKKNYELAEKLFWENMYNNISSIITEFNNFFPVGVKKLPLPDSDFINKKQYVVLAINGETGLPEILDK
jgi:hypothetical protein